jgi:hypothetical protein
MSILIRRITPVDAEVPRLAEGLWHTTGFLKINDQPFPTTKWGKDHENYFTQLLPFGTDDNEFVLKNPAMNTFNNKPIKWMDTKFTIIPVLTLSNTNVAVKSSMISEICVGHPVELEPSESQFERAPNYSPQQADYSANFPVIPAQFSALQLVKVSLFTLLLLKTLTKTRLL